MKHRICPYCQRAAKKRVPLVIASETREVKDWCCVACCHTMIEQGFLYKHITPLQRMSENVIW